jgi:hypothetical protein
MPDFLLPDRVTVFSAQAMDLAGQVSAGTTLAVGVHVALLPVGSDERATLLGMYADVTARLLLLGTQAAQQGSLVEVDSSNRFPAGTQFRIIGDPQIFPDPLDNSAHHKEALLQQLQG